MKSREPTDIEPVTEPLEPVAEPFLRRIEKLARWFLRHRFESPQDLWQFQLNLLYLQRDIQAAINDYKSRAKQDKSVMKELTDLRACRWNARRLGDAFAWALFGGNMQMIEPLSRNDRAGVPSDGHGSRGMLLIASNLASQGWGFPLIHDITDCLRIGDVTFVRAREGLERSYNTVEVKTTARLKRRIEAQNRAEYEYRIQVLSAGPFNNMKVGSAASESTEFEWAVALPIRPVSRHTGRQLKRMSTALSHQTAAPNALIIEDGEIPALWAAVNTPATKHWKTLQKVVRKARRSGYGAECVDRTFLYVAIYSPEGLSPDSMDYSSCLQADLANPDLVIENGNGVNALSISIIPPFEQGTPHLFLPFFLYSIPRSSIIDLLYGRMIIFVCTNEGRLIESLKEAGFSVEFDFKAKNRPLTVTSSATADNGVEYYVQSPNLRHYLNEIIYEFRGRDSIVQAAKAVCDAAASVMTELDRNPNARSSLVTRGRSTRGSSPS